MLCCYYSNAQLFKKRASIVVGQRNFSEGKINAGGSTGPGTLRNPNQVLLFRGKFLVCDGENNRVLIFNKLPISNFQEADLVIGQKDLFSNSIPPVGPNTLDRPSGLATDGKYLFILDRDNHRILVYNDIPVKNGDSAKFVVGQTNFYDRSWGGEQEFNDSTNMSAFKFSSGPTGMTYDSATGKIIVLDSDNNRLMIYNKFSHFDSVSASVVVGQKTWTSNRPNQGETPGANTLFLSTSTGVLVHKGKLLVTDRNNNRVLIYNKIPEKNNQSADVVIGQKDFSSNQKNCGGQIGACGFDGPRSIAIDRSGKLYIAEAGNSRILIFDSIPTTNGQCANTVLGQSDFNSNLNVISDSTFNTFISFVSFIEDKLVVCDQGNHRILFFDEEKLYTSNFSFSNIDYKFKIFPNPSNGFFNIEFSLPSPTNVELKLIDNIGRVIKKVKKNYKHGVNYERFEHLHSNKLYYLHFSSKYGISNFKLVSN